MWQRIPEKMGVVCRNRAHHTHGVRTSKERGNGGAPEEAALGSPGSVVPNQHTRGGAGWPLRRGSSRNDGWSRGSGHFQGSARSLQLKRREQSHMSR